MRFPGRLHLRQAGANVTETAAASAPPAPPAARNGAEEDVRILRRTRLRLIAVSGAVTLVILLILGAAVYEIVSTAVESGARDQLERVEVGRSDADSSQGPTFEGPAAGLIPIPIDAGGRPVVVAGLPRIPPGLPSVASLQAVTPSNPIDIREVLSTDGTPYRVISGRSVRTGLLFQYAQNRTAEVNFLNTLAGVMLGGGLLALLISLAAGYVYAGRALVPIRQSIVRRQEALQRQREFAANASHELRTPLTIIRTSVEDLRRNRRSKVEDVGEAIGDIDAEVRHMTALVEDMLLLARTDSGTVQIDHLPLDMADVAAEAASSLTALGQERGVSVVLDPLPAPTFGDPLRLRQLVTILADNAIHHSPKGSTVTVTVRPEAASALLSVEDQGPGIKPEDMPRLWERFWRADNAPAGGTGLGLAIAKWIVDQHGGQIGAMNREEVGARFWVRLPAAKGDPAGSPAGSQAPPPIVADTAEAGPEAASPGPMEAVRWTPDG